MRFLNNGLLADGTAVRSLVLSALLGVGSSPAGASAGDDSAPFESRRAPVSVAQPTAMPLPLRIEQALHEQVGEGWSGGSGEAAVVRPFYYGRG